MAAGRIITLAAGDGSEFEVYVAGDDGNPRPAVLCYSTVHGLEDQFLRVADSWADQGFVVAVPDYFHRVGGGVVDRSETGRARAFDRWERLDVDKVTDHMDAVVEYLNEHGSATRALGAIGYCAGGELAFLAGTRLGAQAVGAFHGTRIERHLAEGDRLVRASLHFGGQDALVPMSTVEEISAGLSTNLGVDVHTYAGAGHGFSFEGHPNYNRDAATNSYGSVAATLESLRQRDSSDRGGYVHRYVPGTGAQSAPLLLLHRTGRDEHDLIPIGHRLASGRPMLSPRGNVLEDGKARFFGRHGPGQFDRDDLRLRSKQLAEFVSWARDAYGLDAPIAVGFSNGANVAWSTLLENPEAFRAAVLWRPLMPFDPRPLPGDLQGVPVLVIAGRADTTVTPDQAEQVPLVLRDVGAEVTVRFVDAAHVLTDADLDITAKWIRDRKL
jgi:phospholipase/carboxylesterase